MVGETDDANPVLQREQVESNDNNNSDDSDFVDATQTNELEGSI